VAGVVAAVGHEVTRFQPGDEVFGTGQGTFAEYARAAESKLATQNHQDLIVLTELIEAGKITPVIDRTYPLSEASKAIRYLEQGHARGKIVITV
jgi:NADPH:quinone reductase-like Zn-dependent oxidoreductase